MPTIRVLSAALPQLLLAMGLAACAQQIALAPTPATTKAPAAKAFADTEWISRLLEVNDCDARRANLGSGVRGAPLGVLAKPGPDAYELLITLRSSECNTRRANLGSGVRGAPLGVLAKPGLDAYELLIALP